jgi:hypothetical protein
LSVALIAGLAVAVLIKQFGADQSEPVPTRAVAARDSSEMREIEPAKKQTLRKCRVSTGPLNFCMAGRAESVAFDFQSRSVGHHQG